MVVGRWGATTIVLEATNKAIVFGLTKDGANAGDVKQLQLVVSDLMSKSL
jgi:hypothetical protein